MVPETLTPIPTVRPAPAIRRTHVKFRLRFKKIGNLRLVSHHDLMHVVERMMRRAEIPFAVSQGFHPQPRMVFALSLALGVVGLSEVLELELTRPLDPDDVLRRLNAHAPIGLEFLSIAPAPAKGARVRRAFYRLPLTEIPSDLADRIAQFLASETSWIVRTRPTRRRLNVRPFVSEFSLTDLTSHASLDGSPIWPLPIWPLPLSHLSKWLSGSPRPAQPGRRRSRPLSGSLRFSKRGRCSSGRIWKFSTRSPSTNASCRRSS